MKLNINTDAAVIFTNKLEKLHRSALPTAVRGALNKAAFHTKQNTLLKSVDSTFIKRQPNFFKANSRVEMAKGWDINTMKSTIGMTSQGLKGGNNYAVKDLEQQEEGGTIGGRSFIPMSTARAGKNNAKAVRPMNRLSGIKNIVNTKNQKGKNNAEKFIKAAYKAGSGGYVLGNEIKSKQILWRIDSISSNIKNRKTAIKKTALYSLKTNRNVKVSATHFMKNASLESAAKIEMFYVDEANRQIKRLMNK